MRKLTTIEKMAKESNCNVQTIAKYAKELILEQGITEQDLRQPLRGFARNHGNL